MIDQSNKRSIRNVLINRPLQREFTVVLISIMMTAGFIVGVMIHFTMSHLIKDLPLTISRATLEEILLDTSSQLVVSSILIIFLAVIATGFIGVFFLHRVAGPVYRFGQVLKRMSHGEIPGEIHLRPRDFFKETADEINLVIQLLKERDGAARQIDDAVKNISDANLPADATDKIRQIRSGVSQLRKPS